MNHLPITFGICVGPDYNKDYLERLLVSIWRQGIPQREVIIVGGVQQIFEIERTHPNQGLKLITFNEERKPGWITRKKNLIANIAINEYVCLLHDYYWLDYGWYDGVREYKEFDALMSRVIGVRPTGPAYRSADWLVNPFRFKEFLETRPDIYTALHQEFEPRERAMYVVGLPYNYYSVAVTPYQYISGGYAFVRRDAFRAVPMNEDLTWGQAEDVEWSERFLAKYQRYYMTNGSRVLLQKPNKWQVFEMPQLVLDAFKEWIWNAKDQTCNI